MVQQNIRWQQRSSNYRKALVKLNQAVDFLSRQIENTGVILYQREKDREGL